LRVSISPGLDTWAEGFGEWPIADAEDFRPYLQSLLWKELRQVNKRNETRGR